MSRFRQRLKNLDLQAKITLVLLAVLAPVFILLTVVSREFVRPVLLSEAQQMGVSVAQTIAGEILAKRLLSHENSERVIEERLREYSYLYASVRRIDVFKRVGMTTELNLVASTVEDDPAEYGLAVPFVTQVTTSLIHGGKGPENELEEGWEVIAPMNASVGKHDPRIVGAVRVFISIQLIKRVATALSNIIMIVGSIGGLILFLLLTTALRRTIENDRRLHEVETKNLTLSEQLHEAERNLMNLEKFSVLGQLTGSFAHEIGTPLNAIMGHLTLLKEEFGSSQPSAASRISILEGQVNRIAGIVKNFLQTTAKPPSQTQLIDVNPAIEKSLGILLPRLDLLAIRVEKNLDRTLGPIRMAPVELEQVLINVLNNAIDAIRMKTGSAPGGVIQLDSRLARREDEEWLEIVVRDSGVGIAAKNIKSVFRPFYTTKTPEEGTGLGLSICSDLLQNVNGRLNIRSEEGAWTEVTIEIPFSRIKDSE